MSKKYNRGIDEQIACLLHDLSHVAFSHVIDFLKKDTNHEYADKKLNLMIMESDIPSIIRKEGYSLENVLHKEKYPLLDNNLPDISFDRYDYFLRDGYTLGYLPKELIDIF